MKILKSKKLKSAWILVVAMLIFCMESFTNNVIIVRAEEEITKELSDDSYDEILEDNAAIITDSNGNPEISEEIEREIKTSEELEDDSVDSEPSYSEDGETEEIVEDEDENGEDLNSESEKRNSKKENCNNKNSKEKNYEGKKKDSKKSSRKCKPELSKENPTYYVKMTTGDNLKLSVKNEGKKKIKNKKLKFSSNKKSVAVISADGVITAKRKGKAKIKICNRKNREEKSTIVITVTD